MAAWLERLRDGPMQAVADASARTLGIGPCVGAAAVLAACAAALVAYGLAEGVAATALRVPCAALGATLATALLHFERGARDGVGSVVNPTFRSPWVARSAAAAFGLWAVVFEPCVAALAAAGHDPAKAAYDTLELAVALPVPYAAMLYAGCAWNRPRGRGRLARAWGQ